ncbi:MAG: tRNA 2-thiouridine(34) synthase MnmA [Bacteroidaceae bacterium]|nr:tRNA 2-thiouridine(34) synthase MnmA [Bacteroidaceae bacterium]
MSTAVLLSGGVDSAVVVHLLKEQGVDPDLYYIRIGMDKDDDLTCTSEEDIELCTATARRYGLRLEVVDLQNEYWDRVVSYLVKRVKHGLTPNPDVMCNRLIKFGAFEEKVGFGYDRIATGHYGRIIHRDGEVWLGTARDPIKDQTDFLAQIETHTVRKLLLPLGDLMKSDVRRIAEEAHLPSARRHDSQGICFLGKIDYNQFVRRFLGEREGWIVELETGRRLGKHNGYWFHTIGQRRGLNLSGGPWYVVKKDTRRNIVYVSNGFDTEKQYSSEFRISDFHYITGNPWQVDMPDIPVCFKIRHTDRMMHGTLTVGEDGIYEIKSAEPIQGVAPGQFGVLYTADAEICVGSGEIVR